MNAVIRGTVRICCHLSITVAQAVLDATDPHPHIDEPLTAAPADEFTGYSLRPEPGAPKCPVCGSLVDHGAELCTLCAVLA